MSSGIHSSLRTDTLADARSDLAETLGWYITDDDGEPDAATIDNLITDEVAEEWWHVAGDRREQRHLLLRLGADRLNLDEDIFVAEVVLYTPSGKPNSALNDTKEDRRAVQNKSAALGSGSRPKVRVPSIPMSIAECARYLARSAAKGSPVSKSSYTARRLRRLMDCGVVPFEQHGRELFTFCCEAYPRLPSRQGE